jgi:hypothetical protein
MGAVRGSRARRSFTPKPPRIPTNDGWDGWLASRIPIRRRDGICSQNPISRPRGSPDWLHSMSTGWTQKTGFLCSNATTERERQHRHDAAMRQGSCGVPLQAESASSLSPLPNRAFFRLVLMVPKQKVLGMDTTDAGIRHSRQLRRKDFA